MGCTPKSFFLYGTGRVDSVNHSVLYENNSYQWEGNTISMDNLNGSTLPPDVGLYPINASFHKGDPYRLFEKLLSTRVVVAICIFGLLGNILNLLVLTRNSLKKTMHRMEKSSHTGLVALSLSDMLFCIAVIPQFGTYRNRFAYTGIEFMMVYRVYSPGVINTFIMLSTWLTVTMATQRYLAICHPIKARQVIGVNFAKWTVLVVFLLCVLVNIPKFFFDEIFTVDCVEGGQKHFIWEGPMKLHKHIMLCYLCFCFLVGVLFPIVLLTYCNIQLIRALQQSSRLRRMCSNEAYSKSRDIETTHRITLTLIVIVVMYTVLVTPAEVSNFVKDVADTTIRIYHYNFTTTILNTAQAMNFAFNFILYCVINTHFRKTLKGVLLCPFTSNEWKFKLEDSSRTRMNSITTKQTTLSEREQRTRIVSL